MVNVIGEANGGWRDLYHFNDNGPWYFALILLVVQEIVLVIVTWLVYNIGKPKTLKK